jgi:hypothetical protein
MMGSLYEEVWIVEVELHTFLTSEIDTSESSASCPCLFDPGK